MVMPGVDADRPTMHVDVLRSAAPVAAPRPVTGSHVVALSVANASAHATCTALLADPRHAGFAAALFARSAGQWSEVLEVCVSANVAAPADVPRDLFATWLEHPQAGYGLATVVFVSLDSEWCVVVPTKKPTA
jgi:hypothetical protein